MDMVYDGTVLAWNGRKFKATSGMPQHQKPELQCAPDKGPVPEGIYLVFLSDQGTARDDGSGRCQLSPAWGIQKIPRGLEAGDCEPFWANWGLNRVRFEPADIATKIACTPKRGGFHIHDSAKGFSHGCIEVEASFFPALRAFAKAHQRSRIKLRVKYSGSATTNGGTKQ